MGSDLVLLFNKTTPVTSQDQPLTTGPTQPAATVDTPQAVPLKTTGPKQPAMSHNSKICAIIMLTIVIFSQIGPAKCDLSGLSKLKRFPKQTLPDSCWDHFERTQECPAFKSDYEDINAKCCGTDSFLHCLIDDQPNGDQFFTVSCLPKTLVKSGTFMKIVERDGLPQIDTQPCDEYHFEPEDRWSNSLNYPYCTHTKTRCLSINRQLLCRGGPSRDDQCICIQGYESDCNTGLTERDGHECGCRESSKCPNGTERNITYTDGEQVCPSDGEISLNYQCVPVNTPGASSPKNFPSTASPTPIPRTTTKSTDDSKDISKSYKLNFLGFLAIIPVLLAILFILYKYNSKFRQAVDRNICRKRAAERPSQEQASRTKPSTFKYKYIVGKWFGQENQDSNV